jgi:hypothetical protein
MLFDLAKRFPEDPAAWDITQPVRAIGKDLRIHIRRRFGTLQTAHDLARPRSPDRLGISVRPYEAGDPIRAVSASHLFKTDNLQTRTDFAPGRRSALVLLHLYENMRFLSNDSPAAKGRVALAVAGLIQAVHESLGQSCRVLPIQSWELDTALVNSTAQYRRANELYIISDLLFDNSSREAAVRRLRTSCLESKFANGYLVVVRDALEHPDENRLGEKSANLKPYAETWSADHPELFSGLQYGENLRHQRAETAALADEMGLRFSLVSGSSAIEQMLGEIGSFIAGPQGRPR